MAFRRVETNQKRDLALNLCGRLGELPNESIEKAREIAAEILFLLPDKKFRKKRFAIRLFSSGIVAKRSLKFGNWGHCSGFKFYYAQTDEVTGRGAGELSEEVLNEEICLRRSFQGGT